MRNNQNTREFKKMKRSLFSVACLGVVFSASSAVVKEYQRIDGNENAQLPGKILQQSSIRGATVEK